MTVNRNSEDITRCRILHRFFKQVPTGVGYHETFQHAVISRSPRITEGAVNSNDGQMRLGLDVWILLSLTCSPNDSDFGAFSFSVVWASRKDSRPADVSRQQSSGFFLRRSVEARPGITHGNSGKKTS